MINQGKVKNMSEVLDDTVACLLCKDKSKTKTKESMSVMFGSVMSLCYVFFYCIIIIVIIVLVICAKCPSGLQKFTDEETIYINTNILMTVINNMDCMVESYS